MTDADPSHDDAAPVTEQIHENSWSANLEEPAHAQDRKRIVDGALSAIEHTASGYHVNLVTHAEHGHPETYLYEVLEAEYGDQLDWDYVDQCGCGGHVLRVHVP
ncbi:CGCGG family putative rSAM-modified RiPP protein [Halorhabdus salina]|uniref:CGCGG family putative rSAM-modified RiPP protein n=1 Tax=Halorhabdus salina TaxID=2750670 RepID=UPI0015EE9D87|nr:CGCGG family rSAM-modified RiPP protein [Halorhabdus salina]